jgi:hypothetical protein
MWISGRGGRTRIVFNASQSYTHQAPTLLPRGNQTALPGSNRIRPKRPSDSASSLGDPATAVQPIQAMLKGRATGYLLYAFGCLAYFVDQADQAHD